MYNIKWSVVLVIAILFSLSCIAQAEYRWDIPPIVSELSSDTLRLYQSAPELSSLELGGMALGLALIPYDQHIYDGISENTTQSDVWSLLSLIGDPRIHSLTAGLLAITGHPYGKELVLALGFNGINTLAIKSATGMARPYTGEGPTFRGPSFSRDYSAFPSAHTSSSFTIATILADFEPEKARLTYSLAGLVGLSRVIEGEHWPSNVVLGAVLGYFSARHVLRTLNTREE